MANSPNDPRRPARPAQLSAPSNAPASGSASLVHTLTSTLANPYANVSPHYAAAYAQYTSSQHATAQGYTYSSTYDPRTAPPPSSRPYTPLPSGAAQSPGSRTAHPPRRPGAPPPAHWYTPGNSRCTHAGCAFTGSAKAVETHMMDRHLIYPPDWHTRRRQPDWDADPSFKGKPVPIQGTSARLDTPEDLAAWLAERRARWPTAARVAEKKRKLEEAAASGQLHPDHLALHGIKRPRTGAGAHDAQAQRGRGRGGRGGRGRERGRGRGAGRGRGGAASAPAALPQVPAPVPTPVPTVPAAEDASGSDSDSDSDGAPEVVSAKAPPGIDAYASSSDAEPEQAKVDDAPPPALLAQASIVDGVAVDPPPPAPAVAAAEPIRPPRRAPAPQPKKPPRNHFAERPSLLRRLLRPEIRMTVSNLSQAIHFLVENDFLDNVELRPGEAEEKRIEVVGEQLAQPDQIGTTSGGSESLVHASSGSEAHDDGPLPAH
ncbi:hypothetical protein BC834DRAFT_966866 [Gloeopeniophorella convolvens]|nr:hypothetical protein BC834DRAFT_966866 [Gloeopeniophorella convolvens]